MSRLKLLFVGFAALVLVPAGVLLRYGERFIDAEARQLRAEAEADRARTLAAVEADIRAVLGRTEAIEARRPWYHYRHRFVPPDLAGNSVAFDRSPLYPAPEDPFVRAYFEWTPGRLTLATPGDGASAEDEDDVRAAAAEQVARVRALTPALLPELRALHARTPGAFQEPGGEEITSKLLVRCYIDPDQALSDLEKAQKGDLSQKKKLEREWEQHLDAQTKARRAYSEGKRALQNDNNLNVAPAGADQQQQSRQQEMRGPAPAPQQQGGQALGLPYQLNAPVTNANNPSAELSKALAEEVQRAEPLAAAIRTFETRYLFAGDALVAVRLVDLDGATVFQGYELDLARFVAVAREKLSRLGLAGEAAVQPAATPREVVRVVPSRPVAVDALAVLAPSRALLYGSAGLILFLTTAGLGVLYGIVRGHLELARRRTDFVAAVSHELKAPLTAIRALAEMLSLGIVPTRAKEEEYFGHIRAESERLSRLVANVLDLARLERRERSYELSPGDVGDVVRAVAESVRPHLAAQGFAFTIEVAPDLPAVKFDRDAVSQVVANLLDNAAKYTAPVTGRERRIAVRVLGGPGSVVVEVEDSGIGIAPEDRRRLFKRFARGTAPLARGTGGAGLGLSIAKEHVDAHRGTIEVESEVAKGSTFRVTLPATGSGL